MSWSRAFDDPILLPDGCMLCTLRDAGEYIQVLPRAKYKQPEWEVAAEMLSAAVEGSGPLMFAEIAMRKAVSAGKPAPEPTPPRRPKKMKRPQPIKKVPAHMRQAELGPNGDSGFRGYACAICRDPSRLGSFHHYVSPFKVAL